MRPSSRTSSRWSFLSAVRSTSESRSSRRCQALLCSSTNRSMAISDFRFAILDLEFVQVPIENQKSGIENLVECVPNFSEGRKVETVKRLTEAIESVDTAV